MIKRWAAAAREFVVTVIALPMIIVAVPFVLACLYVLARLDARHEHRARRRSRWSRISEHGKG